MFEYNAEEELPILFLFYACPDDAKLSEKRTIVSNKNELYVRYFYARHSCDDGECTGGAFSANITHVERGNTEINTSSAVFWQENS